MFTTVPVLSSRCCENKWCNRTDLRSSEDCDGGQGLSNPGHWHGLHRLWRLVLLPLHGRKCNGTCAEDGVAEYALQKLWGCMYATYTLWRYMLTTNIMMVYVHYSWSWWHVYFAEDYGLWQYMCVIEYNFCLLVVVFCFYVLSATQSPQEESHSHTFTVTPTRLKRKSPKHE